MNTPTEIRQLSVRDIRFPTSLQKDGSDALHPDPDYSCAYVVLFTDSDVKGYGFSFTLGRGTEILVEAIRCMRPLVVGQQLAPIFENFADFYRKLARESQIMWLGPEKGVVHMAMSAILNALWDLRAKLEGKPLWKLLVDLEPEELVSAIDFTYLSNALTQQEAIEILKQSRDERAFREQYLKQTGYPAYSTSAGWLGYDLEKINRLCLSLMEQGFTRFKMKVGSDLEDDKRRLAAVRRTIGWENLMMVDANQRWGVQEAIDWMKQLAEFKPLWIEEPTSPDDILGHAEIAKELNPLGIGIATGENCCNSVMFKQFLQAKALNFCQIDGCRLGSVNENLAVILMAAKFKVPVVPHAGGVGLCELVQHLSVFDYIAVTGTLENRMVEFVDHLHEHFKYPVVVSKGSYMLPTVPGYSTEMWEDSLIAYEYPLGAKWRELIRQGIYPDPKKTLQLQ